MRILHAPENIGGMAGVLARAQTTLGHYSRCYAPFGNSFLFKADYSLPPGGGTAAWLSQALRFALDFDVFHLYFGNSLLGDLLHDLPALAAMKRKVCFYFCGCDIRDEKVTTQKYPISGCAECFPKLCSKNRDKAKAIAERFGRVNFVSTPDLLEFLPRSILLPQAIDCELIDAIQEEPLEPRDEEEPFVIAHAPTSRQIKGTRYLLEVVAKMKSRGCKIELMIVENLSHEQALRKYRLADVAVDQLLVGSYGLLAAELMALGVPTLVYLRDDLRSHYPWDPPVINCNPLTLERQLGWLYDNRGDLKDMRQQGQQYARAVHHPLTLARKCLEYYN